jgi:hypothetical protein
MKSDVYVLDRLESDFRAIPAEAEKVARYNGLDSKRSLRLRLLAEEMICMLPQLLIYGKGSFWIENSGSAYELHLTVTPYDSEEFDRDKVIGISRSGKNAAAVGIIGKICDAVEIMMSDRAKFAREDPYRFFMLGSTNMNPMADEMAWSLMNYKNAFDSETKKQNNPKEWDELEKSVISNLADDVVVGVRGGKVNITVKKKF